MKTISPDFTESTKRILAKMASERCCLCEELTSKPNSSNNSYVNIGEAAHIRGARQGKDLRFDDTMTDLERQHYSNGIWLCSNCHTKIDSDGDAYTVNELIKIRDFHYNRILNGKYDKSAFAKIDIQNKEIQLLKQSISDKEKLIDNKELIYNLELTKLKIKVESLTNERDDLWKDYQSILENMGQTENFDYLYHLVFEEGNIDSALKFLNNEDLQKEEISLVKKYLLKADLLKVKNDSEAINYYKKAYQIQSTFEVASFYIRYLYEIRNFDRLIELINDVLKSEIRPEKIMILRGRLGTIYSKLNPSNAINEYNLALEVIENNLKEDSKYFLYKAGYLNYLATAYIDNGDINSAFRICENALCIYLTGKVEGEKPSDAFNEFCSLYNTLARIYKENSNYIEAEKYYLLALKICNEQLKDFEENKIKILINYSQIYCVSPLYNLPKAIYLINEALSIIIKLYNNRPLEFFELFIASRCKKADYELRMDNTTNFLTEIEAAEKMANQFIKLNYKGYEYLLAEIGGRKMMYFYLKGEINNAKDQLDKSISIFENANFKNYEFVNKFVASLIWMCDFIEDNEQKKNLLITAKSCLRPFINNYNSSRKLLKLIDESMKRLLSD